MTTTQNFRFALTTIFSLILFVLVTAPLASATTTTIFSENFNGYQTSSTFPSFPNDSGGHRTVFGVPTTAKGADSDLWLAARFEYADNDPISQDVGVLKHINAASGFAPTGRVGDDAGLVIALDLTNYIDVELAFTWRTFLPNSHPNNNDRFVVAYYQGDDLGTPGNIYDWFNDPALGNGDLTATDPNGPANTWYVNNWTEVLRSKSNSVQSESGISLPGGGPIYLAFWLDNGDNDLGKFDNVVITGTLIPEPTSLLLMMIGTAGCAATLRQGRSMPLPGK